MVVGVAGALAIATGAATARAAPSTSGDVMTQREQLIALERSLDEQHDALSTSDCATACRALASILRAADKICALDPGDRCAAGRAKADDATRRVREACPECAIASTAPEPKPRPEDRAMTKGGTKAAQPPEASSEQGVTVQASAPPSESKRGGCAGCTTTSAAPVDVGGGILAGLALALGLARRRRRRNAPS